MSIQRVILYELILSVAFVVLWGGLSLLLWLLTDGGHTFEPGLVMFWASVIVYYALSLGLCLTVSHRPRMPFIEIAGRILIGLLAPTITVVAFVAILFTLAGPTGG